MKLLVKKATLIPFVCQLNQIIPIKKHKLLMRNGYLLRLENLQGHVGWGELSPLPFFHAESLEQAKDQIDQCLLTLFQEEIELIPTKYFPKIEAESFLPLTLPSALFCIESAVLDLFAKQSGVSVAKLLNQQATDSISINALLLGEREGILRDLELKQRAGFKTFKLKIGKQGLAEDKKIIQQVLEVLADDHKLRLDANQAYTLAQSLELFSGVYSTKIEYIEEPLKIPAINELNAFYNQTKVPIALDESLIQLRDISLIDVKGLSTLIFKPGFQGGLERLNHLYQVSKRLNLSFIITSSFQSAVGHLLLFEFASATQQSEVAMGLETLSYFKEHTLNLAGREITPRLVLSDWRSVRENVNVSTRGCGYV